jgi:hypothetical protein
MKKLNYKPFSAAFVALFLATTAISQAEPVIVREAGAPREAATTTTSTTTAGTISEFSPDTIIVKSETAPEPIRYTYTKSTTYVDEAGAPVSMETVKSGLPVTVYYTREGDRMIASKVIVRRIVREREPGAVVEERKAPARVIEERERKAPVRIEERERKAPAEVIEERKAPAPAPVIEEKKTTTTTTTSESK